MTPGANSARGGKQVSQQAVIGQLGINLIERLVLRMGSVWTAGNAPLDVGIDGEIELVDPTTRVATNCVIRVQSKATSRSLPNETSEGFTWPVDERDLNYWMSGNAPVVLVVSQTVREEAYWVPVKDYFATPTARKSLKVQFDKRTMRLDESALDALGRIAVPRDSGIYIAPRPRDEKLFTNLLPLTAVPERLWVGETDVRGAREVYERLRDAGVDAPEFVLRDRRILAPYDLTERPWSTFVDRGTIDEIEVAHWAASEDRETINRFVELLGRCLSARAQQLGCERIVERGRTLYFFAATADGSARSVPYRSVKDTTRRTVFQAYRYTKGPRQGEVSYYRHVAFEPAFRRFDGQWHLVITPTYLFTSDGRRRHPLHAKYLSGIKKLEKNGAVLGQVVMWAALLRGRDEDEEGMFFTPPYPHLRFAQLVTASLAVGIDDEAWTANEEPSLAASVTTTTNDLPLFQEVNPYADEDDVEEAAPGLAPNISGSGL